MREVISMSGKYPTPRGQTATAAKRRYNKEHYAFINLAVKLEEKPLIQAAAQRAGKSVNQYIQDAIAAQMERDGAAQ